MSVPILVSVSAVFGGIISFLLILFLGTKHMLSQAREETKKYEKLLTDAVQTTNREFNRVQAAQSELSAFQAQVKEFLARPLNITAVLGDEQVAKIVDSLNSRTRFTS